MTIVSTGSFVAPFDQTLARNRLLQLLPPAEFAAIAAHLRPCAPVGGTILFAPDAPTERVWFMTGGIVSLVAISPRGLRTEAGIVGREGFVPATAMLGCGPSPYQAMIQSPDDCHAIPIAQFLAVLRGSPTLGRLLLRFTQVLATQIAYTALSNAVHPVDERLARWILMCHDRTDDDVLPLTHQFISVMLSVRRPSITGALHVLEGKRLIRTERGRVIVRDRARLEAFAGDAYGRPEQEYRRLIEPSA